MYSLHQQVTHLKIAYCLLVHKNPRQVKRLLKSIHSKEDYYYINVFNGKDAVNAWHELSAVNSDIHVNFKFGKSWGMFPVVQATLDAMRYFSTVNYDYFINLSGQCYPLASTPTIKATLEGKDAAFMETYRLPYALWGGMGGLERISFSYHKQPVAVLRDWAFRKVSKVDHYETRRFLKLPKLQTHVPGDLQPYGGSAYFCITKKHVEYILKFISENPRFLSFFSRSFGPDELVFQTIMLNSKYKANVNNDNLRYIDWSKPGDVPLSPVLLTTDDAEKLLQSKALFARKFDMSKDSKILDLIDNYRSKR